MRRLACPHAMLLASLMITLALTISPAAGQTSEPIDATAAAEAALAAEEPAPTVAADPAPDRVIDPTSTEINILELLVRGGYLMWPIAVVSLVVVTFGLERLLALRKRRVLPSALVHRLRGLLDGRAPIQVETLRQICNQYPSAAANVLRSVLRKAGRPIAEIEHTFREACEREASRLYTNVRWLSLAAGVAPLLGLLGTVWGMIQAFFATANLPAGANKADYLAEGIYVALVTTFAGLAVAIPAGVLAHMFEGRIQRLFRGIDETIEDVIPHLESDVEPTVGRHAAPPHASRAADPPPPPRIVARPEEA